MQINLNKEWKKVQMPMQINLNKDWSVIALKFNYDPACGCLMEGGRRKKQQILKCCPRGCLVAIMIL